MNLLTQSRHPRVTASPRLRVAQQCPTLFHEIHFHDAAADDVEIVLEAELFGVREAFRFWIVPEFTFVLRPAFRRPNAQ